MTIQHHTHPKSLFPCFLREEGFPYQPILSDEDMKTIKTGEPSFTELIESGSVYVDKTAYINKLLKMGQSFYFLSRPRRYGQSLFCSTLHALFDGRKELFKGLYIAEKTNYHFEPFPILHFNFANLSTSSLERFTDSFMSTVRNAGIAVGIEPEGSDPASLLRDTLLRLSKKAVIIIDEYDSALTSAIVHEKPYIDGMRSIFRDFYSNIKNNSECIRFCFITGVTKYSNLSIFSEMNNLLDISMDKAFADAFGYTEPELMEYFGEGMDEYMEANPGKYASRDELLSRIREYYDGYRFSRDSEVTVYNPVSIGRFFNSGCRFDNYWEQTGVSSLAVNLASNYRLSSVVDEQPVMSDVDFTSFDISLLADKKLKKESVYALLYYTGYLTIDTYDGTFITLDFPNREVSTSFTSNLLSRYTDSSPSRIMWWGKAFAEACSTGDDEAVRRSLEDYFSAFSYELIGDERERFYHGIFHSIFVIASLFALSEDRGMRGRADEVLIAGSHIWIFELKVDRTADEALGQIEEKGYGDKYSYLMKPGMAMHKVGISFSSSERKITDYRTVRAEN